MFSPIDVLDFVLIAFALGWLAATIVVVLASIRFTLRVPRFISHLYWSCLERIAVWAAPKPEVTR